MFKEMGPLITAFILASRSGSAYAAEIGTMKVNEELDALHTFGMDPVRFLAVPRVLALVMVLPLLTLFNNLFCAVWRPGRDGDGGFFPDRLLGPMPCGGGFDRFIQRFGQDSCVWLFYCGHRLSAGLAYRQRCQCRGRFGHQRRGDLYRHDRGGRWHICGHLLFFGNLNRHDRTQPEKIIQVKNLTGGYGDTVILKDITFDVYKGEVFIILGGSGCGKSTMLKFMIGLEKPFSGQVFVDGIDRDALESRQYQKALRSFGVMYQNGALFGSMNLMENICLVLEEFTDLPRVRWKSIAQMRLNQVGWAMRRIKCRPI